jgi:hypothetical protein
MAGWLFLLRAEELLAAAATTSWALCLPSLPMAPTIRGNRCYEE